MKACSCLSIARECCPKSADNRVDVRESPVRVSVKGREKVHGGGVTRFLPGLPKIYPEISYGRKASKCH